MGTSFPEIHFLEGTKYIIFHQVNDNLIFFILFCRLSHTMARPTQKFGKEKLMKMATTEFAAMKASKHSWKIWVCLMM